MSITAANMKCRLGSPHWALAGLQTLHKERCADAHRSGGLQAVLAYPMGVVRLMDMMAEREVLRNEALLLMIVLTHANAEVQKIAAFEGAFERLFSIIRSAAA